MIRITDADFQKLMSYLKKKARQGAVLSFSMYGTKLAVRTVDKSGKEMTITLSCAEYAFMPTVTKAETF